MKKLLSILVSILVVGWIAGIITFNIREAKAWSPYIGANPFALKQTDNHWNGTQDFRDTTFHSTLVGTTVEITGILSISGENKGVKYRRQIERVPGSWYLPVNNAASFVMDTTSTGAIPTMVFGATTSETCKTVFTLGDSVVGGDSVYFLDVGHEVIQANTDSIVLVARTRAKNNGEYKGQTARIDTLGCFGMSNTSGVDGYHYFGTTYDNMGWSSKDVINMEFYRQPENARDNGTVNYHQVNFMILLDERTR